MAKKASTQAISTERMNELSGHPVFREGLNLLRSSLVIRDGEHQDHKFPIMEVEPYEGLVQKGYISQYEDVARAARETFLAWHRGLPSLNIVVEHDEDPKAISVVHLRQLELDGKRESIKKVIEKILGLKRTDYENFAQFKAVVEPIIDEQNIDNERARVRVAPDRRIFDIREVVGSDVNNSLGRFVRVD